MRFRLLSHALVSVAVGATLGLPAAAYGGGDGDGGPDAPPLDPITVDVVTVNGSGCPAGTARVVAESDNTGFRITYAAFQARAGGGANATDMRKNCQLGLVVRVPQGFTYAVASIEYSGRAHLEAGADALHRTNYYFQGSSDDNAVEHTYRGPLRGRWDAADVTDVAALVFAPCGEQRNLNVNTELRVHAGDENAHRLSWISMRATEANIDTIFHLQWKQCR
jgi:hypothetical protein